MRRIFGATFPDGAPDIAETHLTVVEGDGGEKLATVAGTVRWSCVHGRQWAELVEIAVQPDQVAEPAVGIYWASAISGDESACAWLARWIVTSWLASSWVDDCRLG